jgi:CheY-like chemotaxis protein
MEIETKKKVTAKTIDFILLVDDDVQDNEANSDTIIRLGVSKKVECLTHALDALTYFKNCLTEEPNVKYPVPDLVFIDFMMPFFTGFEVLDNFRRLPDHYGRKKKIRFVFLTSIMVPEVKRRTKEEYSDLVMACAEKPLQPDLLLDIAAKLGQ